MTLRTILIAVSLLGLPTASYGQCVRGCTGFTDSNGNVWLSKPDGRPGGVIINTNPEPQPSRRQRQVIDEPDGSFTIKWE